ncbi:uncharacterized protein LOC119672146, partial [Teleopsis dalmanni]|uniref:uncharacterized protein LOC119672146 n=1 Tax=Teleopsis dalmanni TaxID=139649 RepID=UPI0018CD9E7A
MSIMASSYAHVVEQIRKWSVRYDGRKNPLGFIERIEELADVYAINVNLVPKTMPILLEDKALMWYRNNNKHWQLWTTFKIDFLKFFISSKYFEKLEDEVRLRLHKPKEKFKDYFIDIQNLMRRACLDPDSQLERIYRNMNTDYKVYIKHQDFTSLNELATLADDFEELHTTQHKVSRDRVQEETIHRCTVVQYPPTMPLQNTMRLMSMTSVRVEDIYSLSPVSPVRNQQQSNQQRNQSIDKQTAAK